MTFLASQRWRIVLIAWMLYAIHFATNVVREHYPAFSIAEHGTFTVDEYEGFHADIFMHRGHAVIGNQVFVSMLAAVPLFVFDPILDALERHSKAKLAQDGAAEAEYRTIKPIRRAFFQLVHERGLDLRFGAATVVTSVFFMAPATALFLAFFYGVLRQRGVGAGDATALAFLLGFGTPVFFRTSTLNHNLFVMYAMFAAFVLLWTPPGERVSTRDRLLAGFFGGITLATDYVGVIILPLLYAYFVLPRAGATSWRVSLSESATLVLGSLPPVGFLLYSQWAMYGNPFLPGQYWMPDQNMYVNEGMRGFTLPAPDLFLQNLFHPGFGMYVWGPVLLLALVPVWRYRQDALVLPARERWFVVASVAAFLLFSSANQYARLQWNSGFRYLLPLVPFLILAITDHWIRMSRRVKITIAALAVLHSWVLTVYREPVPLSWRLLFVEGPQLPWYRVLSMTSNPETPFTGTWWVPTFILAATLAVAAGVWKYGARLEAVHGVR